MRERFECAVLVAPAGVAGAASRALPELCAPRLRLHAHPLAQGAASDADPALLIAAAALPLQRYDACLLPVEPAGLPWVRLALLRAQAVLRTPVLVLSHDVTAPALADLLALGAADFLRAPLCAEELRARLLHIAARRAAVAESAAAYTALQAFEGGTVHGTAVHEAMPAYLRGGRPAHRPRPAHQAPAGTAVRLLPAGHYPRGHLGSRRLADDACSEPVDVDESLREGRDGISQGPAQQAITSEPFRQAKARVVEGFERDYLRQALQRHRGNVAQAARASNKHRRAFWALMRKHRIEAAPYRASTS